jgi:hypothetical protein
VFELPVGETSFDPLDGEECEQGIAAAKRLEFIDEVLREYELEHKSKRFAVRELSLGGACELAEGDAAVDAWQTAGRGSTGDVRLGGGIGTSVATSERFDVLAEDFGEPLGSARASPLGAPAAAAAAAAAATGWPSESPLRTRFETVAASVLALARERKSGAGTCGGGFEPPDDDAGVELEVDGVCFDLPEGEAASEVKAWSSEGLSTGEIHCLMHAAMSQGWAAVESFDRKLRADCMRRGVEFAVD